MTRKEKRGPRPSRGAYEAEREHVFGYCTPEEYDRFLRQVPVLERMPVDDGIILLKYWFSVSDDEQQRRFLSRRRDPMRRWRVELQNLAVPDRPAADDYERPPLELYRPVPEHAADQDARRPS